MPSIEIAAHTVRSLGAFSSLTQYMLHNEAERKEGRGVDIIVFSEHNHFPSRDQQGILRVTADRHGFDAWCGTHLKVFWDWHELHVIVLGVYLHENHSLGNADVNSLRCLSAWAHDLGGVVIGLNVHIESDAYNKSIVQYLDAFAYSQDYAQDKEAVAKLESLTAMADPPLPLITCNNCYYNKTLDASHVWQIPDGIDDPKKLVDALRKGR